MPSDITLYAVGERVLLFRADAIVYKVLINLIHIIFVKNKVI